MIELPWLEPGSSHFPATASALDEPNGLLAAGGDLSPTTLLAAYRRGIFPWFDETQPILWWSPSPRAVIVPGEEHISRSLAKTIRKGVYQLRCNTRFAEVMQACAEPRDEAGTWISEDMLAAYCELHQLGHAHSIEAWQGEQLLGGLYGVQVGSVFFGESMFARGRDASKVAFAGLCQLARQLGIELIDCQVSNQHLSSLGSVEWPRQQFERQLARLVERPLTHPFALSS
ncbi:MAG: leucyl/phenylalanyl-tRNA--protein transferase [Cellvibrionaceae bacterium]|nr:leucyl/phenylalanyl-tRNA--protein transferase [Cellvibrionaceae bacterium]MCV6628108.1 leucyl/phenylalanyl-tRNA--protein transferase [Cellvibrionaceae bacterium]